MSQRVDEPIFEDADTSQGRDRTRDPRGSHRPRARRGRTMVVAIVSLAVLAIGALFAYSVFRPVIASWTADNDYPGGGTDPVTITINPGDTGASIANNLEQQGVVKTSKAFVDALSSTKGDEIQPGTYTLRHEMSAAAALSALRGNSAKDVVRVTIREGLWKSEVYGELAQASGRSVADYQAVEKAAASDPADVGLPVATKGNPEGYLFPDTYTFDRAATPKDQIKQMVSSATVVLGQLGVSADAAQRVLTLASLVEAEARHPEDRPKVARVIENRLADGMPLQLDSTSAYGAGVRTKVLTTTEQREAKNTYNTYAISGLPAGPIGNPGRESIQAALNPADGPWLFFVTTNPATGETVFSTTTTEHDAEVDKLNAWCAENSGAC
ncbi:MAG: endolytic transglycosylase MltG [Dermatophilaceae bacterium]